MTPIEAASQLLESYETYLKSADLFRKSVKEPTLTVEHCMALSRALTESLATVKKPTAKRHVKSPSVSAGRREVTQGLRPKLLDAMALVMGDREMSCPEIVKALKAKKWAPHSESPVPYVSFMLSANRDRFIRVSRGIYRVRKSVQARLKRGVAAGARTADSRSRSEPHGRSARTHNPGS